MDLHGREAGRASRAAGVDEQLGGGSWTGTR